MKKTLNVNLNGRVFTIDEDAYRLLDSYLSNLRICFRKEVGASEIITDFEARIEELFSEKIRLGYLVITLEHVEEVIARVGKPADFEDREDREEEKQTSFFEPLKSKKKFFRNMDDKLIGGVCSGIAAYFGWNVVLIRFILIVSPFVLSSLKFVHLGPLAPFLFLNNIGLWVVLAYVIAWIVVPAAYSVEQKLQMHGKPVTAENIGKTVAAESAPVASKEPKGCLGGLVDLFVSFLKVCLAGLGCLIGIPLLFALFIVIIVLIAVLFGVGGGMLGFLPSFLTLGNPVLLTVSGILLFGIPLVAIVYSIVAHIAKLSPLNQLVKWMFLIIWVLAFILFFSSGLRVDRRNWLNNKRKWTGLSEYKEIRGNGIPSYKTIDFDEAVSSFEIGKYLHADIQIEQTHDGASSMEINGDENLIDQIRHDFHNGRLVLSSNSRLRSDNNLKIKILTNDLKRIQVGFVGNVRMNRAFTGEELEIKMKGVGNFQADSLYVNSLTVRSEGVASVRLSGKVDNASLETAGTGKVDAMGLLSDTVYARVDGVGSIQCNPVDYLEARVNGVGSITYKEEPKNKNVGTTGIGKIRKR